MIRMFAEEAAALIALALFTAMVLYWSAIVAALLR
jgi:hypothetical protein